MELFGVDIGNNQYQPAGSRRFLRTTCEHGLWKRKRRMSLVAKRSFSGNIRNEQSLLDGYRKQTYKFMRGVSSKLWPASSFVLTNTAVRYAGFRSRFLLLDTRAGGRSGRFGNSPERSKLFHSFLAVAGTHDGDRCQGLSLQPAMAHT